MLTKRGAWGAVLLGLLLGLLQVGAYVTTAPLPLLPVPSTRQLAFHRREQAVFFHFGVNTFSDQEQGNGTDDPSIFNPVGLDARQWVRTAKQAGFKLVILTAKHADGFCLWPTAYSNYSVKSSPWKNGTGDVVGEVATAAREEGVDLGLYMSPWDRHEPRYGDSLLYNEYYLAQLRELLTMYGPISEVWLDGNKGADAPDMNYLFDEWFAVIHQLQPNANIFSDGGPDIRWVGDEAGEAGTTSWSMINKTSVVIGAAEGMQYLNEGDGNGVDWVPPECDVSIRPGWFWHSDEQPHSLDSLLHIYYKSVGRNCVLLLNVPPNRTGLLHETDVKVLQEFREAIDLIFSQNLAAQAHVSASSTRGAEATTVENSPFRPDLILSNDITTYWAPEEGLTTGHLQLDLGSVIKFNVVMLQEAITMGQRVRRYHVDVWQDESWHKITEGTTIGYKKLDHFKTMQAQLVRLVIDEARAAPLIASFGLYLDTKTDLVFGLRKNCTRSRRESK